MDVAIMVFIFNTYQLRLGQTKLEERRCGFAMWVQANTSIIQKRIIVRIIVLIHMHVFPFFFFFYLQQCL